MKITFIQTLSTATEVFTTGKEYDIADATALNLIKAGIARAVEMPAVETMEKKTSTIIADANKPQRKRKAKGTI